MTSEKLREYARLAVKVGANVQKGQYVQLTAETDQLPLVKAITEECYAAGAVYVEVIWTNCEITKLGFENASVETLGTVRKWEEERAKERVDVLPVRIFIESEDPDALNGISADALSDVTRMRQKVLRKYRDALDGKHQWLIVGAASPAWAKKLFPDDAEEVAVEKLWDAILKCVYLDTDRDAVEIWNEHISRLERNAKKLNDYDFDYLKYKSDNGTDFKVWLFTEAKFCAARDTNYENGVFFVPNMPTEEIFITPKAGRCEGRLVATKPLSWSGQVIKNFYVDYKDGRYVDCHAEEGEEILRKMLTMDEGAGRLGEVALVPKESPINRSDILFYSTLFDENACCHFAAGKGYGENVVDFINKSDEELKALGVNDSMIHVDYMVGSEDLTVTGVTRDGREIAVFENGTWAEEFR